MITKEEIKHATENNEAFYLRCPRCGGSLKEKLHTNALSRRADVYVCDNCGTQEAIEALLGKPKPFEEWAVSKESKL